MHRFRGFFKWFRLVVIAAFLGGVIGAVYVGNILLRDLPSLEALDDLRFTETSTFFASDGTPMGDLAGQQEGRDIARQLVKLSDVSPAAVVAVVNSEDKRFFQHYGLDFVRLIGGLYYSIKGDLQGGSSITTQVVKQTLLSDLRFERSGMSGLERKLKEFPLAIQLERRYSKEEILEMYLNVVPWGGNAQGIWAASQAYFGKDPSELSIGEGAYLAVLIPSPNRRYEDFKSSKRRANTLLRNMVAGGWITKEDAATARSEKIVPRGWIVNYDDKGNITKAVLHDRSLRIVHENKSAVARYFLLDVQKFLKKQIGTDKLRNEGGLRIFTTLDLKMQDAAEKATLNRRLPDGAQLGMVGMNPNTGEVYAMVGAVPGTNNTAEFNFASQPIRSPGSSVKPFTYGVALEAGWLQNTTVQDLPVEKRTPQGIWKPKNFDGTYLGRPVTIRYAMDRSLNFPAIRTLEALGASKLADKLRTAGFCVGFAPKCDGTGDLANAIGGGVNISALGMAGAYSSFVNGGYRVEPILVTKVEDSRGRVIYQSEPKRTLLWTPQVAYQIWDMLKGYVYDKDPRGRESLAKDVRIPGMVVGGKTGTSDFGKDLWFAGAVKGLVATLWIGRPDNHPQRMNGVEPSSSLVNPPIWHDFVAEAMRGRPTDDYSRPSGLVSTTVDLMSGNVSSSGASIVVPSSQQQRLSRVSDQKPVPSMVPTFGPAVAEGTVYETMAIDKQTGCEAAADTPPERIDWIQVPDYKVSTYACKTL